MMAWLHARGRSNARHIRIPGCGRSTSVDIRLIIIGGRCRRRHRSRSWCIGNRLNWRNNGNWWCFWNSVSNLPALPLVSPSSTSSSSFAMTVFPLVTTSHSLTSLLVFPALPVSVLCVASVFECHDLDFIVPFLVLSFLLFQIPAPLYFGQIDMLLLQDLVDLGLKRGCSLFPELDNIVPQT
ncbi:MAG: hypothetical protein BYD32DRAFT_423507 [Podila humilis]|nr:MAG: hypothetical protein BYD32DRAFT_423507 [Podila humilis]